MAGQKGHPRWGNGPVTSGVGWMPKLCLCKCTRCLRKQAAASFPDKRMPATHFPGAGCYCGRIGRAGHFSCCRMHMGTAPSFTSSTCHSSESLQQTMTWFLYFISALSLFPGGSQVSIGNPAMRSWFFQKSKTRPPQAGRQHSGPWGKKQMDRKATCFPKLFKFKCSFAVALQGPHKIKEYLIKNSGHHGGVWAKSDARKGKKSFL